MEDTPDSKVNVDTSYYLTFVVPVMWKRDVAKTENEVRFMV